MANWTQVDIITSAEGIEIVSAMLTELGLGSIAIQDSTSFESFIKDKAVYWDYIEDDLMKLLEAPTLVTVYLADLEQGRRQFGELEQGLEKLRSLDQAGEWGPLTVTVSTVQEEDWETAWKEYYHPMSIGKRLLICPSWEECSPSEDQVVVLMDPGMAFGTGTHESTKLCLEALDRQDVTGCRVLDIGSGSGILAISAVLLGAESALGVDIDEVAVKTATANALLNKVEEKTKFVQGNLAEQGAGKYGIIFANIVADVILSFASEIPDLLAEDGVFITSGIIDERADEVEEGLRKAGFATINRAEENGWVAFATTKAVK